MLKGHMGLMDGAWLSGAVTQEESILVLVFTRSKKRNLPKPEACVYTFL